MSGLKSDDASNMFHYAYSCDISANLTIKVGSLEGQLPKPDYEQVIKNPILRFAGRNYEMKTHYPSLMVEVVVMVDNQELHLPVRTAYRHFTNRWAWNQWLVLPIRFCDLPLDAVLCINVFDCNGPNDVFAIGGTTISLFSKKGTFRQGMMDLQIWPQRTADGRLNGDTPGKLRDKEKEQFHRLAKLSKKYYAGQLPAIDWLDRLTFSEIERINQKDKADSAKMFLNIEFPQIMDMDIPTSIVYFEMNGDTVVEPPETNNLVTFPDPEIGLENLVEKKHYQLARSHRTGLAERELKPNPEIRNRLNSILSYPTTQPLTGGEKDLLWRFRFYLAENQKALSKFVKCVNWAAELEAAQAMELISKAQMEVEDALELLGPNFTYQPLRKYAVLRLSQASDMDLQLYLLQLVQALKYETLEGLTPTTTVSYEDPTLVEESVEETNNNNSGSVPSLPPTAAESVEELEEDNTGNLSSFLIRRAAGNSSLANYLYWYLLIECEEQEGAMKKEEIVQDMYKNVLNRFLQSLERGSQEQRDRKIFLERQHAFLDRIVSLVKSVARESGNRMKKIERFQSLILESVDSKDFSFTSFQPIPFPLDPEVRITGIVADKATLFKSSLMPAKLTFTTDIGEEYVAIFKNGDDLRQDQLILQIITLMDQLLRRENLDLRLTPYRVLATSSKHGMVEFVDAIAIAEILSKEGSILSFFRKHNPYETGPYGVTAECMDTYVKSCAGYCVITYLLGVGDRHLDNLMLSRSGKLVHIDFGYILGRDPKPLPPPMKLSKEMIEGFGGVNSEHYQEFRRECYTAFLYLRRHANLILNLFGLMVDASVPDIALEPDKTVKKVQDKFRLDLNEEEAVQYMQNLIDVSATAIMAAMVERLHQLAQYWRK